MPGRDAHAKVDEPMEIKGGMPTVAVIGAGPAGLTAAYLLSKAGVDVSVFEADPAYVGGISRTAQYKGYRLLGSLAALLRWPALWPLPLLALAAFVALNRGFYALCFRRGGIALALVAPPLHILYFIYSVLCYALVSAQHLLSPQPR